MACLNTKKAGHAYSYDYVQDPYSRIGGRRQHNSISRHALLLPNHAEKKGIVLIQMTIEVEGGLDWAGFPE